MASPKKVFALFVGIDSYPLPIPPLRGCVADVNRIQSHLSSIKDIELHSKTLLNQDASKERIVKLLKEHLGQANEQDVALFYFSGHGTQEYAPEVFWESDANNKMQALVCVDSFVKPEEEQYRFLADKELRYLIHQLSQTGAHVVTIFDCCHSGDNTRSTEEMTKRQIHYKRALDLPFPARQWSEFIFADSIKAEDFKEKSIEEVLPQGAHIQMAACLPSQSAYESNREGVFTTQLIDLLQKSNNQISYYDLKAKLPVGIKPIFKQTPQMYAVLDANKNIHQRFLGFPKTKIPDTYASVYQKEDNWFIDMGAIHGLKAGEVVVQDADSQHTYVAKIGKISSQQAQLHFENPPTNSNHLRVYFNEIPSGKLAIFIKDYASNTALIKVIEQHLFQDKHRFQQTKEEEAQITIHLRAEGILLTFKGQDRFPLVPVLWKKGNKNQVIAQQIGFYLMRIAQWFFTRDL